MLTRLRTLGVAGAVCASSLLAAPNGLRRSGTRRLDIGLAHLHRPGAGLRTGRRPDLHAHLLDRQRRPAGRAAVRHLHRRHAAVRGLLPDQPASAAPGSASSRRSTSPRRARTSCSPSNAAGGCTRSTAAPRCPTRAPSAPRSASTPFTRWAVRTARTSTARSSTPTRAPAAASTTSSAPTAPTAATGPATVVWSNVQLLAQVAEHRCVFPYVSQRRQRSSALLLVLSACSATRTTGEDGSGRRPATAGTPSPGRPMPPRGSCSSRAHHSHRHRSELAGRRAGSIRPRPRIRDRGVGTVHRPAVSAASSDELPAPRPDARTPPSSTGCVPFAVLPRRR